MVYKSNLSHYFYIAYKHYTFNSIQSSISKQVLNHMKVCTFPLIAYKFFSLVQTVHLIAINILASI